jgi:hypothetical protein
MRDDAARALRVDDEVPREAADLHSVATVARDDDLDAPHSGRFDRGPSPEATMALRHFERLVDANGAGYDSPPPAATREVTEPVASPRRSVREEPRATAASAALAIEEPVAEPEPEPIRVPRSAPGRSYGSHRRADGLVAPRTGYQPGRRTVEITGQAQAPRRRPSSTTAAMVARPDRVALWAFMLAMFLVVMALATANG